MWLQNGQLTQQYFKWLWHHRDLIPRLQDKYFLLRDYNLGSLIRILSYFPMFGFNATWLDFDLI
jgi:hypothetical protein